MLRTRRITSSLLFILLSGTSALLDGAHDPNVSAQQSPQVEVTEHERGIQLYQRGDMEGAIAALRAVVKNNPYDLIAWDHLVLALKSKGKKKEARKALKQVADLRLKRYQKEFGAVCEKITDANITGLELLHQGAFISVENYLVTSSTDDEPDWWTAFNDLIVQGEFLKLAREALVQGKTVRWSEVPNEKVEVLLKPEPAYTEEARRNNVHGTIILRAVLDADGKIKVIGVLKELRYGLTERAIEAARRIVFKPAKIGNRPVTQYWRIQYNFNLY